MNGWFRVGRYGWGHLCLGLILGLGLGACAPKEPLVDIPPDKKGQESLDNKLVFDNLTLEQADDQGRKLWLIRAKKAVYQRDERAAQFEAPQGELFQDGQATFRIQADRGEVLKDGQTIGLKGKVWVRDTRNGVEVRGDRLRWEPKTGNLTMQGGIKVTHDQLTVTAREAKASGKGQQVEVWGEVVAVSGDPQVTVRTERLLWDVEQEQVRGDRPVDIERAREGGTPDRGVANRLMLNLKTKTAQLEEDIRLMLQDPLVNLTANRLVWELENKLVRSDQPLDVVYPPEKLAFRGNQGRFDLGKKVLTLEGDVRGSSEQQQSKLTANQLTWTLETQEVVAEGKVTYQQENPGLNMAGDRAVGKLQDRTVIVSGGNVVTQITSPDQLPNQ